MLRTGWVGRMLLAAMVMLALAAPARAYSLLPNGTFEDGVWKPDGWSISQGGTGRWERFGHEGSRALSVTGRGEDSVWWQAEVHWQPNRLYVTSFWVKRMEGGSSTVISGPTFANRDFSAPSDWEQRGFFFRTPLAIPDSAYRLGEWHMKGTVAFDEARVAPAFAVYATPAGLGLPLGEGESIAAGRYAAEHHLGGLGASDARFLEGATTKFHSNRWWFSPGSQVTYRHQVGQLKQTEGRVAVNVNYHQKGRLAVEASGDGAKWVTLGTMDREGRREFPVSFARKPAIWVRLRGVGQEVDLQVDGYHYACEMPEARGVAGVTGATHYFEVLQEVPGLTVAVSEVHTSGPGRVAMGVQSTVRRRVGVALSVVQEGKEVASDSTEALLTPGRTSPVSLKFSTQGSGETRLRLSCRDAEKHNLLWEAEGSLEDRG